MNIANHGLVIGKFYPPHSGHHYLIETAARHCHHLTVVVMAADQESIPLDTRVGWLRAAHRDLPRLRIVGVTDNVPVDYDDPLIWDQHVALIEAAVARDTIVAHHTKQDTTQDTRQDTTQVDPTTSISPTIASTAVIDIVATSEPYGDELARRLGAKHLLVDQPRETHPVSGTAVRTNLVGNWGRLRGPIRSGLAWRVVFVGAESTGTTTISRKLADCLRARGGLWSSTRWVPEYGRTYTEERLLIHRILHAHSAKPGKPRVDDLVWTDEDFVAVAAQQRKLEDTTAETGSPLMICDTDVFATCIWHTRYVTAERIGTAAATACDWSHLPLPPALRQMASDRRGDLYLLTDHVGVPFIDDGLRDGENIREWMTGEFRHRLEETGRQWMSLTGSVEQRTAQALAACDMMIESGTSHSNGAN